MAGNGLGPYWFPTVWRSSLTKLSSTFFDECNWEKHDEGYRLKKYSKFECDKRMLKACLRDASRTKTLTSMFLCTFLAWFFWFLVTLLGHWSYNRKES